MRGADERGFTLVETMVAIFLLSVLSVGFYQVMFSSVRGSSDAADIAEVAEEARLSFNRMIRDTREATRLVRANDTSYRMWSDFNRNGLVDAAEYEYVEYSYDAANERIVLTALSGPPGGDPALITGNETALAGTPAETLAADIEPVGSRPIFSYVSNFLEFDTGPPPAAPNGETSQVEIERAVSGTPDGTLDLIELGYVSDVNYAFQVAIGGDRRTFFGQAQIRNRRYSNL